MMCKKESFYFVLHPICITFAKRMKNLARHIELLLRNNDCVILPGFGGFIAHDVPAYYVSEEELYYPPSRSISFNAAITMNDGLLAQSYMKSHQIDYACASHAIDVAIEQLTDTLDEEGRVVLPHIGTITQDIHCSLQFTPEQTGIASPAHFGLSAFAIKELTQLHHTTAKPRQNKSNTSATYRPKVTPLHINKEALRRAMSTAAVFLLLLMTALPTGSYRSTDIASLHLTEMIAMPQREAEQATPTTATTAIVVERHDTSTIVTTSTVEPKANATELLELAPAPPTAESPAPTVTENRPTKTYHIIVASLPNHRGANEAIAKYTGQGYTEVTLVERDGRVRISLAQFADKDEANEYLRALRQNDSFQNAWLLAVRTN